MTDAPARRGRWDALIAAERQGPPLTTAVIHPCEQHALSAALEAAEAGLIAPILVGPEAKIRAAAEAGSRSLAGVRIVSTPHSHAAAERGAEMARDGVVKALMKGSLHSDEFLHAILAPEARLKTDRRLSHVYAMDVPAYAKPLYVTDAVVNIAPTLMEKRDICRNAIDLLHILGVVEPRVAILSAVETVEPAIPSTIDAAALTVMAARGQIIGARADGPLAFDNAIDPEAARVKGIESPVAGQADIVVAPDLESGNMLAKQLLYFAGADGAGLVLGARVPIILTSRADSAKVRIASAALAKIVARYRAPSADA